MADNNKRFGIIQQTTTTNTNQTNQQKQQHQMVNNNNHNHNSYKSISQTNLNGVGSGGVASATTPAPTTAAAAATSSASAFNNNNNNPNKYNHLKLYQQFDDRSKNNFLLQPPLAAANNSLQPTVYVNRPAYFNLPYQTAATNGTTAINSLSVSNLAQLAAAYNNNASTIRPQLLFNNGNNNALNNTQYSSSASLLINRQQQHQQQKSEQQTLDDGFLKLLTPKSTDISTITTTTTTTQQQQQQQQHFFPRSQSISLTPADAIAMQRKASLAVATTATRAAAAAAESSTSSKQLGLGLGLIKNRKKDDLIDLETDIEQMSVADLFDPLVIKEKELADEQERQLQQQLKQQEEEEEKKRKKIANSNIPKIIAPKQQQTTTANNNNNNNNNNNSETTNDSADRLSLNSARVANTTNNNNNNFKSQRSASVKSNTSSSSSTSNKKNKTAAKNKVKRVEDFKFVDLSTCDEFIDLNRAILKLSAELNVEKKHLSDLVVFSSLLDCPIGNRGEVKIIVKYNQAVNEPSPNNNSTSGLVAPGSPRAATTTAAAGGGRRAQIVIAPSLNATVETIVYEILISFNIQDLDTSKYLLKIHGLEEYLPIDATLAELKYIHECLVENKDPVVMLVEVRNANTELSGTTASFNRINYIDNEHMMNKVTIESFVRDFLRARNQIEELINGNSQQSSQSQYNNQLDSVYNACVNLREKLRRLEAHIFYVHFFEIESIIERLEFWERSLSQYTINNSSKQRVRERQPLISSSDGGGGGGSETTSITNFSIIFTNLIETSNDALHAVIKFINSASASFNWLFRISPVYAAVSAGADDVEIENEDDGSEQLNLSPDTTSTTMTNHETNNENGGGNENNNDYSTKLITANNKNNRVEIIRADKKLIVNFKSLSRIQHLLNAAASSSSSISVSSNDVLYLRFSICFGTRVLDSAVVKLDKVEKFLQKKSDFVSVLHEIRFDKIDLCLLPREAVLKIQLLCSSVNLNNQSTTVNLSNSIVVSSSNSSMSSSSNYTYQLSESHHHHHHHHHNQQQQQQQQSANSSNEKCLAWGSRTFFDDELSLRRGEYLLCMFPGDLPQICTTGTNLYQNQYPVIQISFLNSQLHAAETTNYVYPDVSTCECDCTIRDFHSLSNGVKERLLAICDKSVVANRLSEDEKDFIHEYYTYLNGIPNALGKVFLSFRCWDFSGIIHFNAFLKQCSSDPPTLTLSESLELLLPMYPSEELRTHAVKSLLNNFNAETIALYLPQLLEALKYERTHNSALVRMLLTFASKNMRFAHTLYWQLREFKSRQNEFLSIRYNLLFRMLVNLFNKAMMNEIEQEVFLVQKIDTIARRLKESNNSNDNEKLYGELENLLTEWPLVKNGGGVGGIAGSCRLPYNISYCTKDIDVKLCSVISSFTTPLKLVFKNIDNTASNFYTIYKIGDDLRQDMFVLQLINVMNQLWIMEGLDLNVLTFACLQTDARRGFIEMITNAETLKEIQKGAAINVFKKSCINDWLRNHNPNPSNFRQAVKNFTRSCAAYSVATYILGIGDRHNDNIMVKYTGHMFHIDFGKYLGDAQTFAGFKRDRTPILFTPDMFFVINQGKDANEKFQQFIELGCRAFQILRKNYHHLLSLIEMMSDSGIPGLNQNAIQYVYKNLMMNLNDDDSANAYKKLVYESLSTFTLFNFAIHTLAQPKTTNTSNYFSFITYATNADTDGRILSIKLEPKLAKFSATSADLFKCQVTRENDFDSHFVYRSFDEFCELYSQLLKTFPALTMKETLAYNKFKEARDRSQAVAALLRDIFDLKAEVSQSEIVYTFFHPILRDQTSTNTTSSSTTTPTTTSTATANETTYELNDDPMIRDVMITGDNNSGGGGGGGGSDDTSSFGPDVKGRIKVKLKFKENKFYVNCLQCTNLRAPASLSLSSLKPYVKCYLRPDANKATKQKVQALYNGANPIFTETMEYDISLGDLKHRTLEISVLNNKLNNKERIGSVEIRLYDINWNDGEFVKWYELR